jgi:hypothetical protein
MRVNSSSLGAPALIRTGEQSSDLLGVARRAGKQHAASPDPIESSALIALTPFAFSAIARAAFSSGSLEIHIDPCAHEPLQGGPKTERFFAEE